MSERGKFENEWGTAFEGTEDAPSGHVWSNINAELSSLEAKKQRKSAIYWRWVAAACLGVLVVSGVINWFGGSSVEQKGILAEVENTQQSSSEEQIENRNDRENVAEESIGTTNDDRQNKTSPFTSETTQANTGSENPKTKGQAIVDNESATVKQPVAAEQFTASTNDSENSKTKNNPPMSDENTEGSQSHGQEHLIGSAIDQTAKSESPLLSEQNDAVLASLQEKESNTGKILGGREKGTPSTYPLSEIKVLAGIDSLEQLAVLHVDYYMQKVPDLTALFTYTPTENIASNWAGISMGGGNFNSNINRESFIAETFAGGLSSSDAEVLNLASSNSSTPVIDQTMETPSYAYAFGLETGKRIGKRFMLTTGLEYVRYTASAQSNFTMATSSYGQQEAFLNNNAAASIYSVDVVNTDVYELNNSFEYLTVPLEAGYLLFNKKVGFIISSGLAPGFFLKNTVNDKSGQYADVVQKAGSESPYRPVNINMQVGGELFYQLGQHYRIGIEPTYRFSLPL